MTAGERRLCCRKREWNEQYLEAVTSGWGKGPSFFVRRKRQKGRCLGESRKIWNEAGNHKLASGWERLPMPTESPAGEEAGGAEGMEENEHC